MGEKATILIVDDDVNFRNTLVKILDKKGYEALCVESGFRALETVKEKKVDVILMDIKMPVMNGVETYKKLKAANPGIKVILMTAFSVEDLIRDAVKEGVYAVVRKPFDAETIINMIEKSKNGILVTIVDDDLNFGETMKSILERKGYSVRTCLTGEDAVASARDTSHNVFFVDMKLPVLNGLEVYLEIKKINPKAVVTMITAYRQEMEDLIKQAAERGAYPCLYKPFDMNEAIKIVEEVLKKRQRGGGENA